jgi:hypothetical protein
MIIIFGSFRERKLNGTSGLFLRNWWIHNFW